MAPQEPPNPRMADTKMRTTTDDKDYCTKCGHPWDRCRC